LILVFISLHVYLSLLLAAYFGYKTNRNFFVCASIGLIKIT